MQGQQEDLPRGDATRMWSTRLVFQDVIYEVGHTHKSGYIEIEAERWLSKGTNEPTPDTCEQCIIDR